VSLRAQAARALRGPEFLLVVGRSVGFAASFFIPLVLVRVFHQADFGTYKQLFLVFSTVSLVTQAGLAESLFYFLPSARQRAGSYVANTTLCLALLGLAAAAVLWAGAPAIASWMNNPALEPLLPWLGIFLMLSLASESLEVVLIANRRYVWAAASYGLSDLLRSALFVLPALLTGRLQGVLVGGVIFAAVRVLAAFVYFVREFRDELRLALAPLRTQLAYALPFAGAVVIEVFQGNLHQYVVSARFDAATFAIYAVGCLQIPFVDLVAGPAGNVMMVRMSEKRAEGDFRSVAGLWHQTTLRLAMIFFPMAALVLILARDLILFLFTSAYAASVPIFMAWSLSVLFPVFQTDGVLRVFARTRFLLVMNALRLLVIMGSIFWFLSTFGLLGAVFVTLFGMLVAKIVSLVKLSRLLGTGFRGLLPWRGLAATAALAAAAALPAYVVVRGLSAHPLAGIVLGGATYAVLYLAALAWAGMRRSGPAPKNLRAVGAEGS
jgi:O-antigen/teichoic acid export membrane protein